MVFDGWESRRGRAIACDQSTCRRNLKLDSSFGYRLSRKSTHGVLVAIYWQAASAQVKKELGSCERTRGIPTTSIYYWQLLDIGTSS